MPKDWYLDVESESIVVYKGHSKLSKSGCLGGKSLESTTDADLGPLLNVEATESDDKLKVSMHLIRNT